MGGKNLKFFFETKNKTLAEIYNLNKKKNLSIK